MYYYYSQIKNKNDFVNCHWIMPAAACVITKDGRHSVQGTHKTRGDGCCCPSVLIGTARDARNTFYFLHADSFVQLSSYPSTMQVVHYSSSRDLHPLTPRPPSEDSRPCVVCLQQPEPHYQSSPQSLCHDPITQPAGSLSCPHPPPTILSAPIYS